MTTQQKFVTIFLLINSGRLMKTFEQLKKEVLDFNQARGWNVTPQDAAKSILIEGAELLEHYQWDTTDLGEGFVKEKNLTEIGYEAADVLWYLITFCYVAGININKALEEKIEIIDEKYPEEKFNGKHNEDFYRKQKKKYRKN